ncbi:hypothetical protein [uncultured Allofournierella sp.]|uniref:hypothetical protein n=1 Tax=uncultured Allofournierella sp. TaxID=1940258 RepID=UPI0025F43ADD|nr:hypothetical protein [uncultured Fournierella sp.]
MFDKLKKYWVWGVITAPFLLMILLHLGIAVFEYTGFNFNIKGVTAADWFMFAGSYLGGAITLGGVVLTLRHERKVHQHQINIDAINKEKEFLSNVVCGLDIYAPSSILYHFWELEKTNTGYKGTDIAEIQRMIADQQRKLSQGKMTLFINTDVYFQFSNCTNCKIPCRLADCCKEFKEIYEKISGRIYDNFILMDSYISQCEINAIRDAMIQQCRLENSQSPLGQESPHSEEEIQELESKKKDVSESIEKLKNGIAEIAQYGQNEIPQLGNLIREYYSIRCQNAWDKCFSNGKK